MFIPQEILKPSCKLCEELVLEVRAIGRHFSDRVSRMCDFTASQETVEPSCQLCEELVLEVVHVRMLITTAVLMYYGTKATTTCSSYDLRICIKNIS